MPTEEMAMAPVAAAEVPEVLLLDLARGLRVALVAARYGAAAVPLGTPAVPLPVGAAEAAAVATVGLVRTAEAHRWAAAAERALMPGR